MLHLGGHLLLLLQLRAVQGRFSRAAPTIVRVQAQSQQAPTQPLPAACTLTCCQQQAMQAGCAKCSTAYDR